MKKGHRLAVLFMVISLCAGVVVNPQAAGAAANAEIVHPPSVEATATPNPAAPAGVAPAPNAPNGVSGPSMYVDGTDYVAVPSAALPTFGDGAITLEAWVYPVTTTGCHAVFGKDYFTGFWFGICDGHLRFHRGGSVQVQGTTVIPTLRWTHIAVQSYLEESPISRYFLDQFIINGEAEDYLSSDIGTIHGTRELRIGYDQGPDFFNGDIAEARIWSGALGPESIRSSMHVAINEKRPGLVANWHLISDFKDSMGNADGVGVGGPAFVGWPSPAVPATAAVDQLSPHCLPPPTPLPEPLCLGRTAPSWRVGYAAVSPARS